MKKTKLATLVAFFCTSPIVFAQEQAALSHNSPQEKLNEIVVSDSNISDALVNTSVSHQQIFLKQSRDVKDVFAANCKEHAPAEKV